MKEEELPEQENKAANTVNVGDLQNEVAKAKKNMQLAEIREKATIQAMTMGVDSKSIRYLLNLADLTNVSTDTGENSEDKIRDISNQLDNIPNMPIASGKYQRFTDMTQGFARISSVKFFNEKTWHYIGQPFSRMRTGWLSRIFGNNQDV